MRDSHATKAERRVQPKFRIVQLAAGLVLLVAILQFDRWMNSLPNREELGWRAARIEFEPVALDARAFAPLRLEGAWQLTSDDPRFGGISALKIDGGQLLALSDSSVLIRFSPPDRRPAPAVIGELPDGPGSGALKRNRDSEAVVRDPGDRGWWVAFEHHHELWLYDRGFDRALDSIRLGDLGWQRNRGIEGAAAQGGALLLFAEKGDRLLSVTGSRVRPMRIGDAQGRISDATALGSGQIIAVERRITPLGIRNALVMVDRVGSGYRFGNRFALPLGRLDNVEAIAVEPLPNGARRLWLMTDDNFQPLMRTLLIALDLPAGTRVRGPGAAQSVGKRPGEG